MASRSSSKTDVATTSPTENLKTEAAANTQPVSSNISTREKTSGEMATNEKAVDVEAPAAAADEQLPSAPGMEPWRQSLILVGLLLSAVLMALDGTMITTAIPVITKDFDSIHDIGWYGSVYYLALVLAQPILGSLFFQLNSRYVFWSAIVVFEIGSIVAATAKASYILIIGRAIAGAGGAGLFSGALIIANFIASDEKKPVYVGMISSCFGLGSAVGPLIGGAFTDSNVTWRFCFWLSLPVGFVSFICTIFYSPPSLPGPPWYKAILGLDWAGLGLLTSSLVLLLFALQLGGTTYAWNDSVPIGLLVGFAISLILFLCWQFFTTNANHILSARILKIRTVSAAAISELFFVFGVQIQLYYLPIYLQVVKGSSPLLSGVQLIPYLGAMAVSPIISGILTAKTRMYQPFLWFGLGIFVVGAGLFFAITPTSTLGFVIGGEVLAGFGVGICMQTIITAIQSSVQPQDIPLGTGLHVFMVALGPTIGIAAAQQLFLKQLRNNLVSYGIDATPFIQAGAVATPSVLMESGDNIAHVIASYTDALDKVYLLTLIAGCVAFVAGLFVKLQKIPKQA